MTLIKCGDCETVYSDYLNKCPICERLNETQIDLSKNFLTKSRFIKYFRKVNRLIIEGQNSVHFNNTIKINSSSVLIVENKFTFWKKYINFLINKGYKVFSAKNYDQAINFFKKSNPKNIILDLKTIKFNGYDLLKEIRLESEVPIIVLDDFDNIRSNLKNLFLSNYKFLNQTFTCLELEEVIRSEIKGLFDNFTESSIKVMMLSQEEARRMGHNFVGTEQILLGLINQEYGLAAKVLNKMGLSLKRAREEVERIIGKGSGFVEDPIPFTPKLKRVLENSSFEALRLGDKYVGTEHLLLGMIKEEDSVGLRVLKNIGINKKTIARELINKL